MTVRFADTNILLYAVSTDAAEAGKAHVANAVLEDRQLHLSAQVLQEFYVQATRASRERPLSHEQAAGLVESFLRFEIEPTTAGLVLDALATRSRFGISYWDAAIIEAARRAGCDVVLSEDLQDGQDFDGVSVENPFSTPRAWS
ncbi:MAG TPA: PIN domain-containing protein [Acidimicrobiales bacterium]|nr:PIN domain-containing protein [Acidimicrobiales bacterium]